MSESDTKDQWGSNREIVTLNVTDMASSDMSDDGYMCVKCKVIFATKVRWVDHWDEPCLAPNTPTRKARLTNHRLVSTTTNHGREGASMAKDGHNYIPPSHPETPMVNTRAEFKNSVTGLWRATNATGQSREQGRDDYKEEDHAASMTTLLC